MKAMCVWLTDRLDQQLHVYQLKTLIKIVKVKKKKKNALCEEAFVGNSIDANWPWHECRFRRILMYEKSKRVLKLLNRSPCSLFLWFRSRTVTSGCRAYWTARWTTRATRPFTTGSLSRKPRQPCRPRTACRASPWGTAMKRRVNVPPVWKVINSKRRGRIPALLIGARASCSLASATLPSV